MEAREAATRTRLIVLTCFPTFAASACCFNIGRNRDATEGEEEEEEGQDRKRCVSATARADLSLRPPSPAGGVWVWGSEKQPGLRAFYLVRGPS